MSTKQIKGSMPLALLERTCIETMLGTMLSTMLGTMLGTTLGMMPGTTLKQAMLGMMRI